MAYDNPILAFHKCVITIRSFSIYLVRIAKCSRQTNLNQIDHSSKQIGQYFKVE